MEIISFKPLYMERVWGGRDLETKLGRTLPEGGPIGESWEVVDRPEAQSVVRNGQYAGKTIAELRRDHAEALLGPDFDSSRPFPILVKWLDCQERLSLQVHPPASVAPALQGEPKTENWYMAACDTGASLTVGLKKGTTREAFEAALKDSTLENCVHQFPVNPGDSILVESGRLHAINGGNLILEIQQNSDTTYRVYDWGRVGLDGAPRTLHVEESLQSIDFNDFEPAPLKHREGDYTLAECTEFRIRKFQRTTANRASIELAAGDAQLVHIVSGSVTANDEALESGYTYLVPYASAVALQPTADCTVLVTDHFLRN